MISRAEEYIKIAHSLARLGLPSPNRCSAADVCSLRNTGGCCWRGVVWAQALDADFQRLNGVARPARSYEGLVTAVYQYHVRGGWTLQPNFRFITHPGGGATNPLGVNQPGKILKDAAVFALRTVLKF
jgi:hypothetical protein